KTVTALSACKRSSKGGGPPPPFKILSCKRHNQQRYGNSPIPWTHQPLSRTISGQGEPQPSQNGEGGDNDGAPFCSSEGQGRRCRCKERRDTNIVQQQIRHSRHGGATAEDGGMSTHYFRRSNV